MPGDDEIIGFPDSSVILDNILCRLGSLESCCEETVSKEIKLGVTGSAGRVSVSGGIVDLSQNRIWNVDLVEILPSSLTGVTKVSVDTYGRVVYGDYVTPEDIPGLTEFINNTVIQNVGINIEGVIYVNGEYVLDPAYEIPKKADIANWNEAYSWGNHALAGYLTSADLHDPVTLGVQNGLSLSGQILSLGLVTPGSAGAMSAADKQKLDSLVNYVHPTYPPISLNATGKEIISRISVDSFGHVYYAEKRELTLEDLDYEPYELPVATASVLGGVKIGNNITVEVDGTISVADPYIHPGYTQRNIDTSGATVIDVITSDNTGHVTNITTRTLTLSDLGYTEYELPIASGSVLGGIKVGDGLSIDITGVLSATYTHPTQSAISVTATGVEVMDSITVNTLGHTTAFSKRTLPTATSSVTGVLSLEDWNIFNNKQNALTIGNLSSSNLSVTGGSGSIIGGGVTINLADSGVAAGTYNNVTVNALGIVTSGSNVSYLTSLPAHTLDSHSNVNTVGKNAGYLLQWDGTNWIAFDPDFLVSESDPVFLASPAYGITGTDISNWNTAYSLRHNPVTLGTANGLSLSTQVLSLGLSSGSTTGALSSTDWNTFNDKQSLLVSGVNIKTINGVSLLGSGDMTVGGVNIKNAGGASQWITSDLNPDIRFEGTGDTSISFNATTRTVTVNSLPGAGGGGAVISFNSRTGSVVSQSGDYNIDMMGDVSLTSLSNLQILQYNSGTGSWVNVALNTDTVPEGSNLYFTNTRARSAISLTTTGTSGASTYNNSTGVFNIPVYQAQLNGTGFVKATGTTITYDNNTYALASHNHTLDSLSNVTIAGKNTGNLLQWDGAAWVNIVPSSLGFTGNTGTVTSVAIGNGLTGTSPITTSGTITLGTPSTLTISTTNSVTSTSHTHAITPNLGFIGNGSAQNQMLITGTSPFAPVWTNAANLVSLNSLSYVSGSFVKMTGAGTFSLDTTVYATAASIGNGTLTLAVGSGLTGSASFTANQSGNSTFTVGLDADLVAIAALSGTSGLLRKTAADTWTLDTNTYLTSFTEVDPVFVAWQFQNRAANTVLAAPSSSTGVAAFRLLVASDIPNLDASKITTGTFADARIASSATWNAKQNALSGTGIVVSTAGTISYITNNSSNWNTAYSWGDHAGLYSLISHNHTLDSLSNVTITSKATNDLIRWNGTAWVNWTPNFITGNQTITLSGDVSGSGTTSITTTLATITDSGVGSFLKVTRNSKGLITGTQAVTQSDITGLLGSGSITNTMLQNSSITVNGTSISLGSSATITSNTTNPLTLRFDTGVTDDTDRYIFNGSSSKAINIVAGTNISFSKAPGVITISANDTSVGWSEITSKPSTISGYGITDFWTQVMSGYTLGTNITLDDDDTLIEAFGKIQSQLNAKQSTLTPAALTRTNDTNITVTLGGTPNTALLQTVSLTLGWTGTLAVSRGGTGVGTITGVVVGTGTSALSGVTGTANQVLRRNATNTAYEFYTLPSYLTTETDPIFTSSPASSITGTDIINWNNLIGHNHTLDSLSNVTITSNSSGEILKWNGTAWINNTLSEADIAAASRTITINGTAGNITSSAGAQDLTANRTWTINLATAGTAGTYTKVTTDSFGRVVSGQAQITVSDISDFSVSGINYWVKTGNDIYYSAGRVVAGGTIPTYSVARVVAVGSSNATIDNTGTGSHFQVYNTATGAALNLSLAASGVGFIQSHHPFNNVPQSLALNPTGGNVVVRKSISSGFAPFEVNGAINQSSVTSSIIKTDTNGTLVAAVAADITALLGTGNYIINQHTSAQTPANFWISGIGSANQFRTSEYGYYGRYATSDSLQGVWSISSLYQIASDFKDFGAQYGIVYGHTNAGHSLPTGTTKVPITNWGHQILFTHNGEVKIGMSLVMGHLWLRNDIAIGDFSQTLGSSTSYSTISSSNRSYLANNLTLGKTGAGGSLQFRRPTDGANNAGGLEFTDNNNIELYSSGGGGTLSFKTSTTVKAFLNNTGYFIVGNTTTSVGSYHLQITGASYLNGTIRYNSTTASSLLKTDGNKDIVPAVAGTDYVIPAALSGYVPTSRTLTAGDGLTGGGNLTADRTFTLGTPSNITLATSNSVTSTSHTHNFAPGGTTAQYIRGDGTLQTLPTYVNSKWTDISSNIYRNSTVIVGTNINPTIGYSPFDTSKLKVDTGMGVIGSGQVSVINEYGLSVYSSSVLLTAQAIIGDAQILIDSNAEFLTIGSASGGIGWRYSTKRTIISSVAMPGSPPAYTLYVHTNSDTADGLYVRGKIHSTHTISFDSDIRFKSEIGDITNPLDILKNIKPSQYIFKGDRLAFGFIAQEVQRVLPSIVFNNNGYLSMDYNSMIAINSSAILQTNKRIDSIEEEVKKLREENKKLREQLNLN